MTVGGGTWHRVSAREINVSSLTTILVTIKLIFVTFGEFGNNVRNAFIRCCYIQHYSSSSEMYFLEGGNKKAGCVVGRVKSKQEAAEII